ncbi:MAG: glycosyltransferase family 2 protein [Deltaproteobacteria bacterium]|nr:glycosyltransferase family 2 protein [Deltaproteobacteria bacterium]
MGEPAAPRVAAVVVHWRRPAATRACLAAIAALQAPGACAVVVDNGSGDFDPAWLAPYPGARLVRSETNRGFAGGSNLGMRAALAGGADWVWFLNDDAAPEPAALGALLAAAAGPQRPQLLGAKIVQAADPTRLDSVALDLELPSGRARLLGHDEVDRGQYDALREPLAVTGCALLVSRRACEQLGGFEERFFAYFEDADLCLRARRANLAVAAVPAARVRHDRAVAHAGRQSADSLYYSVRNHLVLLALHGPCAAWLSRLRSARVLAGYLAYAALRGGGSDARARISAVLDGYRAYERGEMGPRL